MQEMTDGEMFNLGRLNIARMYDNCHLVDESPDFKVPEWVDAHAKFMERMNGEVFNALVIPRAWLDSGDRLPSSHFFGQAHKVWSDRMAAMGMVILASRDWGTLQMLDFLDTRPWWAHDNEPWFQND